MKVQVICIGKTAFDFVAEGSTIYEKRLKHYVPFEWISIPDLKKTKSLSENQIKEKEGELLLKMLPEQSILTLLDVRGKQQSSEDFAQFINSRMLSGAKILTFVIGGAYGFSPQVYQRAQFKISLSKMTFSHQLVRVLFMEQLYRAFTILRDEPYHH